MSASAGPDVRGALKQAMAQLRAAGVPSATLAAELLLMHTLGRDRAWLYAHPEHALDPGAAERYFSMVARRAAGVPTQHLTGRQEFWGLEFEVTPEVLIPRPETEHVVEVALACLGAPDWEARAAGMADGDGLLIADVGTGSGCIAVALAHRLPGARFVATDISAAALAVARRNAARHGVAERIEFRESSLLDCFLDSSLAASPPALCFDLVVSNPPYVAVGAREALPREVREHEPAAALFAGETGAELYPPLIEQAARLLRPGAALVVELGHDSLGRVLPLFVAGWEAVEVTRDLAGIPRVLSARRV